MSISNNRSKDSNAPAYVTTVNAALTTILNKLPSMGIAPEEREEMPKIDARFKVFVEKEILAIKNNSSIFPSSFSALALQEELELHNGLDQLVVTVGNLADRLKDFQSTAGN